MIKVINGIKAKKSYMLSVIICTYNSDCKRILMTIESILVQKGVDIQLIISDDGSQSPCIDEITSYLEKRGYRDYKLLIHEKNVGTVENYNDAVKEADGEYIVGLGAGDFFFAENTVAPFLKDMIKKGSSICFGDAIYYQKKEDGYGCKIEVAHPQNVKIYSKNCDSRHWKNVHKRYYVLYEDIFLPVGVIYKTDVLKQYSGRLIGKVKYAEDNFLRLMILDGVECTYYPENVVFYEWGEGISTKKNSPYALRLKEDWDNTTKYICEHCKNNFTEQMIKVFLQREEYAERRSMLRTFYLKAAYMYEFIYRKRFKSKRMTEDYDVSYIYRLEENYEKINMSGRNSDEKQVIYCGSLGRRQPERGLRFEE